MDELGRWGWLRAAVAMVGVVLTTAELGGRGVMYAAPALAPYVLAVRSRIGAVLVGALSLVVARRLGVLIGGLGPESEAMGGGFVVALLAVPIVLVPSLVDRAVVWFVGRVRR